MNNYLIIAFLLLIIIFLFWRNKRAKINVSNQINSAFERITGLEKEIEEKRKIEKIYEEYFSLFHTYYNEDWNRDTPFVNIIEQGRSFIFTKGGSLNPPFSLNTPIDKIPIREESKLVLKEEFGMYWEHVSKFPLGRFLMLMADLKSYRHGSSENGTRTPKEFLEWRIKFE